MMPRDSLPPRLRRPRRVVVPAYLLTAVIAVYSSACGGGEPASEWSQEPWAADAVMPADFVKELSGPDKPVIVCTAPPVLYRVGHIPGAVLHGPGISPAAIGSLTTWAEALPRSTKIVIYCGCCPIRDCPNLNLPYEALKNLGFTNVRVLALADSFRVDWVQHGYPIER